MPDVLFVCRENIGRSPVAEAYYNQLNPNLHANSAGIIVDQPDQRVGEREEAAEVIDAMREEGLDIADHRRQQVTPPLLQAFSRVIVMAELDVIPDWLSQHPNAEWWEVKDFLGLNPKETREVRDDLKQRVLKL